MTQAAAVIRKAEKRTRYYDKTLVLTCTVEYPEFVSRAFPWILNRMNAYYRQKAEDFKDRCGGELYDLAVSDYRDSREDGYPFNHYEAMQTYAITYNQFCTISLYTDAYQFTGGAHGGTIRSSDSWNLMAGTMISLSDLFEEGFPYRDYIFEKIDAQIKQSEESDDNIYFDDASTLARQAFSEENFYLTGDGIVIYFQQYDIAPYASGIVEFLIPYQEGVVNRPGC